MSFFAQDRILQCCQPFVTEERLFGIGNLRNRSRFAILAESKNEGFG